MQELVCNYFPKFRKHKKQNSKADTGESEREIDRMVYGLYGLGKEERKIIEGYGGLFEFVPITNKISTTEIIKKIKGEC